MTKQKLNLSARTKKAIQRKVWTVWGVKKAAPLALLAGVAAVESYFVSFGDIAANTALASDNFGALSEYMYTAVMNAELYVLAGALVLFSGLVVYVKNTVRDLRLVSIR